MLPPVPCLLFHACTNSSTPRFTKDSDVFHHNKLSACSLRSTAGKLIVIVDESIRRFSL